MQLIITQTMCSFSALVGFLLAHKMGLMRARWEGREHSKAPSNWQNRCVPDGVRCLIKAYSTHTVCAAVPGDSISGENYVRKRGLRTCQKVGYSTEMHLESFISCHPHPPLHPSTHSANCLDFSRGELSVGAPSLLRAVLIYAVNVRQVTEGIQLMAGRSGGEGGGKGGQIDGR